VSRRLERVRRAHGEAGSALVIALVFISLFGLFIAAQASWGGAAQHADVATANARAAQYGADGALQGAIARYKSNSSACVADSQPHDFFTYHAPVGMGGGFVDYTVQCRQDPAPTTGGNATPPTDYCPSNATSSDFTPVNSAGGTATLAQTVRYMEQPSNQGAAYGHIAATGYPRVGNNTVALNTFVPCDASLSGIPAGASFQQVDLRVSHSETTSGGSQTQSIKIVTPHCASGTTYSLPTAKPSGGPYWPNPPYYIVTGVQTCIQDANDLTNAVITYQAAAPCAPSCGLASDQFDGAVLAIRLQSQATSSVSTGGTKPGLAFFTDYGNCVQDIGNWGTRRVVWTQSGTCHNPPTSGTFNEPNCVNVTNCGGSSNSNPANYSQVTFCGSCAGNSAVVGDSTSILFSGFTWPNSTAPILSLVLRVVHAEQFGNFKPTVVVTTPAGTCTFDNTNSALATTAGTGFKQQTIDLSAFPQCQPTTQATFGSTTVLYTLTCATAGGQGGNRCGTGGTTSPINDIDALLFDFNYASGNGPLTGGGTNTNPVTFTANVSNVTKGTATYDPTDASVDSYNVSG
jgi:hypothetical protein